MSLTRRTRDSDSYLTKMITANHHSGVHMSVSADVATATLCLCSSVLWGPICKNILSDRFSIKTAKSAHIWLNLHAVKYICTYLAKSARSKIYLCIFS